MPYLLHIYSNCYADKKIGKIALNSEVFLGKLFQKKANACLIAEPWQSLNQQHPQLNGTKRVKFEIVYARVHLLNEGELYKMDQ